MKAPDPVALFRLSVLGPIISRPQLSRGELKTTLRELACRISCDWTHLIS
jgi:hypothetical protein